MVPNFSGSKATFEVSSEGGFQPPLPNSSGDRRSPSVPIGLVLESQSPNLSMNQSSDSFSMFGGTTSSDNIISIPSFDQFLQNVIGNTKTKTKRQSFTKKRR